MNISCPLCLTASTSLFASVVTRAKSRMFFRCPQCMLIFVSPDSWLSKEDEQRRYEEHMNDVNDIRYQEFLRPLVDLVLSQHSSNAQGLDYGCGPGPVAAHLLSLKGYSINLYDPYFFPRRELRASSYDFIICSEVAEHFKHPREEFEVLRWLLRPGGRLYIMTLLWTNVLPFSEWHYQRDLTHVSFYCRDTFEWITKDFEFQQLEIQEPRLVVLRKRDG